MAFQSEFYLEETRKS